MGATTNYAAETPDPGDDGNAAPIATAFQVFDTAIKAVSDVANAAVPKSQYDANTVLYATTDNTPAALAIPASTVLGRKASGNISAVTMAELRALIAPTPDVIEAAGTTRTLNLNGDTEMDVELELDQPSCQFTFSGWTNGKLCFIFVTVVGSSGKTFTFADSNIIWSRGHYPVSATSGATHFTMMSRDGGTTVYGLHDQKIKHYVWGPLNRTGAATAGVSSPDFPVFYDERPVSGISRLATAGTGSSTIVDVNKNGTTMYTTQANRPTIAISATSSGSITLPDVMLLAPGDRVSFDIDQAGTSAAGLSICFNTLAVA